MDKDEVTLLFLALPEESVAKSAPLHDHLREGESMTLNIPILYEGPWENAAKSETMDINFGIQVSDCNAENLLFIFRYRGMITRIKRLIIVKSKYVSFIIYRKLLYNFKFIRPLLLLLLLLLRTVKH